MEITWALQSLLCCGEDDLPEIHIANVSTCYSNCCDLAVLCDDTVDWSKHLSHQRKATDRFKKSQFCRSTGTQLLINLWIQQYCLRRVRMWSPFCVPSSERIGILKSNVHKMLCRLIVTQWESVRSVGIKNGSLLRFHYAESELFVRKLFTILSEFMNCFKFRFVAGILEQRSVLGRNQELIQDSN